jgi:hypothetical protein
MLIRVSCIRCTCDGGEAAGRVVAQRVVDGERDILAREQVCEAAERVQEADVRCIPIDPSAQHVALVSCMLSDECCNINNCAAQSIRFRSYSTARARSAQRTLAL